MRARVAGTQRMRPTTVRASSSGRGSSLRSAPLYRKRGVVETEERSLADHGHAWGSS